MNINNFILLLFIPITASTTSSKDAINTNSTKPTSDTNSIKSMNDAIVENNFCYQNFECGLNEVCAFETCRCKANYKRNGGYCQRTTCKSNADCWSYDYNRICNSYGLCDCKYGFAPDAYNDLCEPSCTTICGLNEVCVENTCRCKPNYNRDQRWGVCTHFLCRKNSDCYNNHDIHRECVDGLCKCKDGYTENDIDLVCVCGDSYSSYLWFLLILPFILVAFVVYCRRTRKKSLAPIPSLVVFNSTPPPPPYSEANRDSNQRF